MFSTLYIRCSHTFCFWCYWFNCWCVFSCYFCTVFVNTFNCYTTSFTCKLWFWSKCHYTIFVDSVSSFAWYFLLCCSIIKCWFNSFIDFYSYFLTINCCCTWCKYWSSSLFSTLYIFRYYVI